jgi:hypothetical protein
MATMNNPTFSLDTIRDQDEEDESFIDECTLTTSKPSKDPSSESRDEAEEIRKQSAKETARVKTWRILVGMALLVTAVAVTATTYHLLVQDEQNAFNTVVREVAVFQQWILSFGLLSHILSFVPKV